MPLDTVTPRHDRAPRSARPAFPGWVAAESGGRRTRRLQPVGRPRTPNFQDRASRLGPRRRDRRPARGTGVDRPGKGLQPRSAGRLSPNRSGKTQPGPAGKPNRTSEDGRARAGRATEPGPAREGRDRTGQETESGPAGGRPSPGRPGNRTWTGEGRPRPDRPGNRVRAGRETESGRPGKAEPGPAGKPSWTDPGKSEPGSTGETSPERLRTGPGPAGQARAWIGRPSPSAGRRRKTRGPNRPGDRSVVQPGWGWRPAGRECPRPSRPAMPSVRPAEGKTVGLSGGGMTPERPAGPSGRTP